MCGDFNDWSPPAHPMKRRKNGRFSAMISLLVDKAYRRRFLLDVSHWENDWDAEMSGSNEFGTEDSLIRV